MTDKEEIIYAPIEIESAEQLHDLGATWKDCRTWKIGVVPVTVYLVPANQETRDYLLQELRDKYANRSHEFRCQVPGRKRKLIACPLTNCCSACPYGRDPEEHYDGTISLDQMMEDGCEPVTDDLTASRGDTDILLESVCDQLRRDNPMVLSVVRLLLEGYTVTEISERLHKPLSTVYRWLKEIRHMFAEQDCG